MLREFWNSGMCSMMGGMHTSWKIKDGVYALAMIIIHTATGAFAQEYCSGERFTQSCGAGEVIVMREAQFGQMRTGRCIQTLYNGHGCSVDVLQVTDALCSGRKSCEFTVPHESLHRMNPCAKELMPYLQATATCLPVVSGIPLQQQCHSDSQVKVTDNHGYIASLTSRTQNIGTTRCPWVIEAAPGHRINVTLWDFGAPSSLTVSSSTNSASQSGGAAVAGHRPVYCQKYAEITEDGVHTPTTVCSGARRMKNVYLSETNRIRITALSPEGLNDDTTPHFLLEYQAVGCEDPPVQGNMIIGRTPDMIKLHCNTSGADFTLNCRSGSWQGHVETCVTGVDDWSIWRAISEEWSSPYGILLVVGLGALLGIVIGFALLAVALYIIRRRRKDCPYGLAMPAHYDGATDHEADDSLQVLMDAKERALPVAPPHGNNTGAAPPPSQQHAQIQQRLYNKDKPGVPYHYMVRGDGTVDRRTPVVTAAAPCVMSPPSSALCYPGTGQQIAPMHGVVDGRRPLGSFSAPNSAVAFGPNASAIPVDDVVHQYSEKDHVYEKPT